MGGFIFWEFLYVQSISTYEEIEMMEIDKIYMWIEETDFLEKAELPTDEVRTKKIM